MDAGRPAPCTVSTPSHRPKRSTESATTRENVPTVDLSRNLTGKSASGGFNLARKSTTHENPARNGGVFCWSADERRRGHTDDAENRTHRATAGSTLTSQQADSARHDHESPAPTRGVFCCAAFYDRGFSGARSRNRAHGQARGLMPAVDLHQGPRSAPRKCRGRAAPGR